MILKFAENPPAPKHKPKDDYFDSQLPGFLLEVRSTRKATYCQRCRDKYGRTRQARNGPVDFMPRRMPGMLAYCE